MKHSVATQRKRYILHNRDNEAIKATTTIREALGISKPGEALINENVTDIATNEAEGGNDTEVAKNDEEGGNELPSAEANRSKGKKSLSEKSKQKLKK